MSLTRWLRHLVSAQSHRRTHANACPPAGCRPRLEALEDRTLPSTLTVLNTADSGPGSLRDTIAAAHSGDTIDFAPALFGQAITITSVELVIDKSLDIEGPGGTNGGLRINCILSSRVFDVTNSSATVVLSNLSIYGGGILNQGANLSLSDCILGGGGESSGGGIYNAGGSLAITRSFLSSGAGLGGDIYSDGGNVCVTNTTLGGIAGSLDGTALGGAIYLAAGNLSVVNCFFDMTQAVSRSGFTAGGAIYQAAGSVLVNNCSFDACDVRIGGAGGAIFSAGGDLVVNNTMFLGDGGLVDLTAFPDRGGAIYKASGNLSLNNTVFAVCGAVNGGALYLAGGTATVTNCDFSGNVALYGGALFVSGGSLSLTNCGFADNVAKDAGDAIDVVGGTVCISKNTFTGSLALDPSQVVGSYTLS
jgi:hypothetical protein